MYRTRNKLNSLRVSSRIHGLQYIHPFATYQSKFSSTTSSNGQQGNKARASLAERLFGPNSSTSRASGGRGRASNAPVVDQAAFDKMREEFAALRKQRANNVRGTGKGYGQRNWGMLDLGRQAPDSSQEKTPRERHQEQSQRVQKARARARSQKNAEAAAQLEDDSKTRHSRDRLQKELGEEYVYDDEEEWMRNRHQTDDMLEKEDPREELANLASTSRHRKVGRSARRPMRQSMRTRKSKFSRAVQKRTQTQKIIVEVGNEDHTPLTLASHTRVPVHTILRKLQELGESVERDSVIDPDICEILIQDLGHDVVRKDFIDRVPVEKPSATEIANMESPFPRRPPVVAVMGHVDHGKTTLLDVLRSSRVSAEEAGGITQGVSSFLVDLDAEVIPGERLFQQKSKSKPGRTNNKDQTKAKKPSTAASVNALTFVDTPGHALFSGMRACGAAVTDIVVLVVAAEDGVMPQTKEAVELCINHDTLIPFMVAVTKVDRYPDMDEAVQRISNQLLELGVQTDQNGGDVPILPISAMSGEGLQDLKEMLLLQSEELELRADKSGLAEAITLESHVHKGLGPVIDVIMRWGSLKRGDYLVCGTQYCRVKALLDSANQKVSVSVPGEPVRVVGFNDVVPSGEWVLAVESEADAQRITNKRSRKLELARLFEDGKILSAKKEEAERAHKQAKQLDADIARYQARERQRKTMSSQGLEIPAGLQVQDWEVQLHEKLQQMAQESSLSTEAILGPAGGHQHILETSPPGGPKIIPAIVKADSHGSLEAIRHAVALLPSDEVQLKIVRSGVGDLSEGDFDYAVDTEAFLLAFNVKVPGAVRKKAEKTGRSIIENQVIYHLMGDLAEHLSHHLQPITKIDIVGKAEVSKIFNMNTTNASKIPEVVAGCKVTHGHIPRNAAFRVEREGEIIYETKTAESLRRFKERVERVDKGHECGISLGHTFTDYQPGDVIVAFEAKQEPRQLNTVFS